MSLPHRPSFAAVGPSAGLVQRSARRRAHFTVAAALCGLASAACSQHSPQAVCAAPETLDAVRGLLLEGLSQGQSAALGHFEHAFSEMATIELITFEGMNSETETVACRAQVNMRNTNSGFDIAYSRQSTVDDRFIYSIGYDAVAAWNWLGMSLASRASELGSQASAGNSHVETAQIDEATPSIENEAPQGAASMHSEPPSQPPPEAKQPHESPSTTAGPARSGRFRLPVETDADHAAAAADQSVSAD